MNESSVKPFLTLRREIGLKRKLTTPIGTRIPRRDYPKRRKPRRLGRRYKARTA